MYVGKDGGEVCESLSVSGAGHLVLMEHKARGILDIWLKKTNKKQNPPHGSTHSFMLVQNQFTERKKKKLSCLSGACPMVWQLPVLLCHLTRPRPEVRRS